MSHPFPGMDPWLENARIWQGVHNSFIVYAAEMLQALIRPRFIAAVESRVYISSTGRNVVPDVVLSRGRNEPRGVSESSAGAALLEPDQALVLEHVEDEIHEAFVEILDLQHNQEIVTVIELLSSSNKLLGEGHDLYREKQRQVLESSVSLVEIDLLRSGRHVLAVAESDLATLGTYDYLVAINRSWDRAKHTFLYPRTIRQRLPRIAVPLSHTDAPVTLDLQAIVDRVYDAGAFADRLNYDELCVPRLRPDDDAWARERIDAWKAAR